MEWMYYRPFASGAIRLRGRDRKVFLQGIVSNDLEALRPDQAVLTMVTNAAGRILDFLVVLDDDEALLVLTLPRHGESTFAYLRQHLVGPGPRVPLAAFRETTTGYDVFLSNESRMWDQALLLPGDGPPPAGLKSPRHAGYTQRFSNGSAAISLPFPLGGGLLLLNPKGVTVMMVTHTHLLDAEAYTLERVRRGILGPEHELTAEFSPFELGLEDFVALKKEVGFPGRTALAHEARHNPRPRTLVGLRLQAPVTLPAFVRHHGASVGRITTTAVNGSVPVALAVVRPPYHASGSRLTVHYTQGRRECDVEAVVVPLPMAEVL